MALAQAGDPIFPIVGLSSGPLPSLGIVLLQFDFLTSPQQSIAEAVPGPNYALTPIQVETLIAQLQRHLRDLGSSGTPSA